ncbi:MAG: site-specific integrase, partial [Xanthobacteraceae bacterium]
RRELNGAAINLPAERTKTAEPHEIYLTDAMRAVLAGLPTTGRFVLTGGDHPINGGQRARDAIETPDLAHWTLHDLRRSFSTGCARIGVQPFLIELMLNHQFEGEAGTYNKHKYAKEMAAAWQKWSAHVTAIVK